MTYKPKPIDTSGIRLPESLEELTEKLAEHVHDIWATRRISEGWNYAPVHSSEEKVHPDLVEYKQLPESDKEYDRSTAMETLKAIIALGYRIEKD